MSMYLAIDIGTTSAKAALYQEDGSLFAVKNAAYPIQYPAQGWAEENPLDWWQAVKQLCHEILSGSGNPLRPAILWLDRRSQPQVDWLVEHVGLAAAERVSANTIDSYYGGVKWLW